MSGLTQNKWIAKRLKYLATINDEALPENTDPDLEISYVDIGNVDSTGIAEAPTTYRFENAPSRARRIVKHGDVIISTVRTYLQAIASIENPPINLIVSTGFAVVRPMPNELDMGFCKYALRENSFLSEVEKRSVGVSYPAVNSSELGDILIKITSIQTQRLIAAYLDRETAHIDALIAAKERLLALLAEKRQALITRAVTRGLSAEAMAKAGLNPEVKMKNSGVAWLGEVPEGWEVVQLKRLSKIPLQYGANEAALDDNPDNPRFVRITDIDEYGNLKPETFRSLPPNIAAPYLLEHEDILFARSGATVGKTFMYNDSWGKACFAGYLIRFRCNQSKLLPNYLYFFTQSDFYWSQINEGAIQATIPNFSGDKYASMLFVRPPLHEQYHIVKYIQTHTARIDTIRTATERSIALLKERRSALIAAAVTGQIEIPVS